MPLPRGVARFNRAVTNRLTSRFAGRAPYMAIVIHRGRKSGNLYRTPVNVFGDSKVYRIALTYGPGSDWVQNVIAAGGCTLKKGGRTRQFTQPRLVHGGQRIGIPWIIRTVLRLGGVSDFLELTQS